MKLIGKIKIYKHKGQKHGKTYFWEQAKILVRSEYIDKLRHLDGQEVSISIGEKENNSSIENNNIYKLAAGILLDKFFKLSPECQKTIRFTDAEFDIVKEAAKELGLL